MSEMSCCKKSPERMCVACRGMMPKNTLIKVTKSKDGQFLVADGTAASVGRGAYVCKASDCVSVNKKRRGLNRAFKGNVPESVYQKIEEILETVR